MPTSFGCSIVSQTFTVAHGALAWRASAGAAATSAVRAAMRIVRRMLLARTVRDAEKFL